MDIIQKLTEELQVKKWQVEAAVKLIDEGNTIPFISRYRKEATGALNDEQLRDLGERLTYLRNLEDKKAQVISSIEEQGKLTKSSKQRSRQRRHRWLWMTFIVHIVRNAGPVRLWQKRKDWKVLPILFFFR